MGWWSDDIMGGDTPLDIQSFIYDSVGLQQFPEGSDDEVEIPKDKFKYGKIVAFLTKDDDYWIKGDTGNIFHQVLGVMMMKSGAPINKTLKAKMIKSAENDEWANEGELGRQDKMDAFVKKLHQQDGNPTETDSKGLMETMGDVLLPKDDAYKDLNKDLNTDMQRRIGWLEKRMTLSETEKDYIALMMKDFAQYYYSRFK